MRGPCIISIALTVAACAPPSPRADEPAPVITATATPAASQPALPASSGQDVQEQILYIDSKLVDCVRVAPGGCMQARRSPDGAWEVFNGAIEGFEHEEGFSYTLKVAVKRSTAADEQPLSYKLIEIVEKKPAP